MQSLLADGEVILYLLFQQLTHIINIDAFGEINDIVDIQNAAVGLSAVGGGIVFFEQHFAVFLDEYNVRVEVANAQAHAVRALVQVQVDVQQLVA